ncbi:hypothetical protein H7F53_14715 [Novosphingobium piscinae]|uniref:DUF4439 domain-containing protein n=1 Tax=Novosphingobium piscinae TaxID=1507448 RepID=A0A7X1G1T9_9SPHN|nr:hypothetical protein [Novosphingobium piscinae]MBC2670402.1 hypothetical protein [Novosphingobium piscinae]
MTALPRSACLLLLAGLSLASCSRPEGYPSLARRPQEVEAGRITGSLPAPTITAPPGLLPAEPTVAAPTGAGLAEALAALRDQAAAAHGRFADARGRAGHTIVAGRGAAPGSEAWALAAVAIADLTAAHDATATALAELDGLYVRARIDGGDGGAIAAVRDQVTAWVADEDAVLAELVGA